MSEIQIKELRIANNSADSTECSDESFQLKVIFKASIYEADPTSPVCCFEPSVKIFKNLEKK